MLDSDKYKEEKSKQGRRMKCKQARVFKILGRVTTEGVRRF